MKEHCLGCADCNAQFASHAQFERNLREAMEVSFPPPFEQRLASAVSMQRRRFFAAAALGLLAIGTGAYAWVWRPDALALACIEFVLLQEANSILSGSIPHEEAERALAGTLPLTSIQRIGQLRHVGPCPFNGQNAYHIILEVPQGKVTLLVMPQSGVASDGRASRQSLFSRVVSLRSGSVGVIGADAAVVDSVAGALQSEAGARQPRIGRKRNGAGNESRTHPSTLEGLRSTG